MKEKKKVIAITQKMEDRSLSTKIPNHIKETSIFPPSFFTPLRHTRM